MRLRERIGFAAGRIGALLLEQDDQWTVQRARCMSLETIAPLSDDLAVNLPPLAAWSSS